MSMKSTVAFLSVAVVGVAAIAAPLTATAQTRNPPQAQHQQGSQGHGEQRPGQNQPGPNASPQQRPSQGHEQANTGRYRITSTVNIRSGPGANFRRVGQLKAGRTVQVDQVRDGWLHVNGQGWISARYAHRA